MNVTLTPHEPPNRTLLFGGIANVRSDGRWIYLRLARPEGDSALVYKTVQLATIREIALDDEPGDWWD